MVIFCTSSTALTGYLQALYYTLIIQCVNIMLYYHFFWELLVLKSVRKEQFCPKSLLSGDKQQNLKLQFDFKINSCIFPHSQAVM